AGIQPHLVLSISGGYAPGLRWSEREIPYADHGRALEALGPYEPSDRDRHGIARRQDALDRRLAEFQCQVGETVLVMVTDRSGCPRGHGHDAVQPDRGDIDVAHRMSGGGLEVHRHPSAVRAWVERTWVEADVHRHRASAWRDRNDFDTGRRAEEPARGDGGADSGQRVHLDHAVKEVRNDDVAAGVDGDGAGQDRAAREEDRLPPRHRVHPDDTVWPRAQILVRNEDAAVRLHRDAGGVEEIPAG